MLFKTDIDFLNYVFFKLKVVFFEIPKVYSILIVMLLR